MPSNKKPRKKYRPKPATTHTIEAAVLSATVLTEAERDSILAPSRQFLDESMSSGMPEQGYIDLHASMHAAMAIEEGGIIKGLHAEFEAAIAALDAIHDVCVVDGKWTPQHPTPAQFDAIESAIDYHDFQLKNLAGSEFRKIIARLTNQTKDAVYKQRKATKCSNTTNS